MMKPLAAVGLVAITCVACAAVPRIGGGRVPEPLPPMGPQIFISPFGEPYQSLPGEPYPVAAWFSTVDTDADGRVSQNEFSDDGLRFFIALDANQDGVIGQQEIVAYEEMATRLFVGDGPRGPGMDGPGRGRPGGHGPQGNGPTARLGLDQDAGQDGDRGGVRPGGGPPGEGGPRGPRGGSSTSRLAMAGLLNVPQPVKAADVDINQRITPQEWSQAGDRWFRLLDTDRDGFLTLAELPLTRIQQDGARPGPAR